MWDSSNLEFYGATVTLAISASLSVIRSIRCVKLITNLIYCWAVTSLLLIKFLGGGQEAIPYTNTACILWTGLMDWTHGLDSWTGLTDWYKTGNWTSSTAVFVTENHSSHCLTLHLCSCALKCLMN